MRRKNNMHFTFVATAILLASTRMAVLGQSDSTAKENTANSFSHKPHSIQTFIPINSRFLGPVATISADDRTGDILLELNGTQFKDTESMLTSLLNAWKHKEHPIFVFYHPPANSEDRLQRIADAEKNISEWCLKNDVDLVVRRPTGGGHFPSTILRVLSSGSRFRQ